MKKRLQIGKNSSNAPKAPNPVMLEVKSTPATTSAGVPVIGRKDFVMQVPKRNPRQEYRLKQREQIDASPFMSVKYPKLKSLTVNLDYYDAAGITKNGAVKCKLNVEHAKSVLWYACPCGECVGGDFDLSKALAGAVAARKQIITGEMRCQGTRKRGDRGKVPCQTLLRYTLSLKFS